MSIKQLESNWEKVKKIIISNTMNANVSQILENYNIGCQADTIAEIFSVLFNDRIVDKENGMCFLKNDEEIFLYLGEDTDGDCKFLHLKEGKTIKTTYYDLDGMELISEDKAKNILDNLSAKHIIHILSFYEDGDPNSFKISQKISQKERKQNIEEIIDGSDFSMFYSKVMKHVYKLLELKTAPKIKKVTPKIKKPLNIDSLVEKMYTRLKFDKNTDETLVKNCLKNIYSLTLENQPVNPFSVYNEDIVGIVSLFRSFASVDNTIRRFWTTGLRLLSSLHPNLNQITDVLKTLKSTNLDIYQIVKVKYLFIEDSDSECVDSLFWWNGSSLENKEEIIQGDNYGLDVSMDRISLEYPSVKEVENFIVKEMKCVWNSDEWERMYKK
jgi:hypothetical protein